MDQDTLYEAEIAKLKALNKQNLDIWNRLHVDPSKGSAEILTPVSLTFSSAVLTIQFQSKFIPIPNLQPIFKEVPNFFNDVLPSNKYFNLEHVLDKYSYLAPKKSFCLLLKWKNALELVQVCLGKIDTQQIESDKLTDELLNILSLSVANIQETIHVTYEPMPHKFITNVNFSFEVKQVTPECIPDIKQIATTINSLFRIKDVRNYRSPTRLTVSAKSRAIPPSPSQPIGQSYVSFIGFSTGSVSPQSAGWLC